MKKVEGCPDFYRDPMTNAVINMNANDYDNYMKRRERKKREKEEISSLKNEVSELKSLIRQLIDKDK